MAIYSSWEQHLAAIEAQIATNTAAIALVQRDVAACYGSCYEDNETGSAISLVTADLWYPWVTAQTGLVTSLVTFNGTAGQKNLVIGTEGAGTYLLNFFYAGTLGATNELRAALFKGSNQIAGLRVDQDVQVQAKYQTGSISGVAALAAADVISARFGSGTNSQTFTIKHAFLTIARLHR